MCNASRQRVFFALLLSTAFATFRPANAPAGELPPPLSSDGSVKVALVASAPHVVTPIGATIDARGRLLVIESNTHFRPKNYQGPKTDRILEFTLDKDGKSSNISIFYEAGTYLMNIVTEKDGSVLVSSRNEIFRLVETNANEAPPIKTTLAHLETGADYPHNGLHGLAVDKSGNVYIGLGENLGGAYTLVGSDGKKLSDDKGSGAIFRVDAQGRGLTLIAHGFWNPFGLGFDENDNLFCVDNDPDGRPPCRLIHVVPGGDYGYEFRYGRTGLHPLQAWDGELPGTLGMVAGVGEAPVAVVWNRGHFYVSSWRDHVIQKITLVPRGATFTATVESLVTGPESFRPTGIAFAPDGSLFVNDWGSASYEVNRKGAIWRLAFANPAVEQHEAKPNEAMARAEHLRQSHDTDELTAAMDDPDPFVAQAAQYGLSKRLVPFGLFIFRSADEASSRAVIGILAAKVWRGLDLTDEAINYLFSSDDRVRQMAVRAISEQNIKSAKPALEKLLDSQVLSPRLLAMTVAVLNQLDGDKKASIDSGKISVILLARLNAANATSDTKATALRMLQSTHGKVPLIPLETLRGMASGSDPVLALEAVRYLRGESDPGRFAILAAIAENSGADWTAPIEAVDGLSDDAAAHIDLLLKLANSDHKSMRGEALRSLKPAAATLTGPQKDQLTALASKYPDAADLVGRILGQPLPARPAETDLAAWQKILDKAPGDPEAGRRIFFHPALAGCYRCHMVEGRGRSIGPDLTMIGHSQTREHVLESILQPSKEIAPLFTMWSIKTKSGKQVDGMLLRRDGQSNEVYVDATGQETTVKEPDVAERHMRKESLMPEGLAGVLTDQELRDLVAYLLEKR